MGNIKARETASAQGKIRKTGWIPAETAYFQFNRNSIK